MYWDRVVITAVGRRGWRAHFAGAKLRGGCLLESWRSREWRCSSTLQGGRFAPGRLDPPNRPQG